MRKKLLLAIVFMGNTLLFGQTGNVKGKIIDAENKEEMSFANVQLEQNGIVIAKAITNDDGSFTIKDVPAGVYELKSAYLGYKSINLSKIVVRAYKTTRESLMMQPSAIMLSPVVICEYIEPLIDGGGCLGGVVTRERCTTTIIRCGFGAFDPMPSMPEKNIFSDPATAEEMLKSEARVACSIYPNPFMDFATLEIDSEIDITEGSVQIFDMSGKRTRNLNFSGRTVLIEREDLAPGVYVYHVSSQNSVIGTGRIVVQ